MELSDGIVLCTSQVLRGHAAFFHVVVGPFVEGCQVLLTPRPTLEERLCACLVDEVGVQQSDGRKLNNNRVAFLLNPSRLHLVHIDAQAQSAVVDTYQFVVAEESSTNGVDHFLVADGQKLPLADSLH